MQPGSPPHRSNRSSEAEPRSRVCAAVRGWSGNERGSTYGDDGGHRCSRCWRWRRWPSTWRLCATPEPRRSGRRTRSRSRAPARSGTFPATDPPTLDRGAEPGARDRAPEHGAVPTPSMSATRPDRQCLWLGQGTSLVDRRRTTSTLNIIPGQPEGPGLGATRQASGPSSPGCWACRSATSRRWRPRGRPTQGPTVNCLKPFVMPDMWYESDKTTQDVNGNNYMEPDHERHGQRAGWRVVEVPAGVHRRAGLLPAVRSDVSPTRRAARRPAMGAASDRTLTVASIPSDIGLPILLKPQTGSGNTEPAASGWATRSGCWISTPAQLQAGSRGQCVNAVDR